MNLKLARILASTACAAALAGALGAASPAQADIHWIVTGVFDDGGTLSGWFNINVYGYLAGYDLVTTAGTTESGFDYNPTDSYWSNGTFIVQAQPGYHADLHLDFANPINVAAANNPLVGGESGPSYECVNSYSCYVPKGGTTRYIASGSASVAGVRDVGVPEPAAWALMITGFGRAGAAPRRRRSHAAA